MADFDSLPTLLRPLLEWLGVIDGAGNVSLSWLSDPAAGLNNAITTNLPKLVEAVSSLLGARDASGLGLVVNAGETWHPLFSSDASFAAYLVLAQQGAGVEISVGLRSSVPGLAGPPPIPPVALTARVPLVALDGKGGVTALLGNEKWPGALDLAIEVDKLGISKPPLQLDGARFGISIPFTSSAPKASLDLLGASLGGEPAHTISLSDFTTASPEVLLELVRTVLGGNALYADISNALGLDGRWVPLLSWSSLATGGTGAVIAWLAQIAASPAYSASWTASVQKLIGLGAPGPVVLALGLTADGLAPTFTVNLTTATPAGNGMQVVRAVLAPFSLSFHGAPTVSPVSLSVTLRMDGATPATPLVSVATPTVASIQAAEFGFSLSPSVAQPVQLVCRLEGVKSGVQTWPVVDMTQLSTTISAAAAGASTQLSSLLNGANAIIQILGLVAPSPQSLALLASDPLRALDCFWKTQDPIAPPLNAVATALGLPLLNPPAPDAAWGVRLVNAPPLAVQFDIGVIPPIPLLRPYRTLFASVNVATRFVGNGVAVDASIEPRLIEYVNGERCVGVTPTSPAWLPQIELLVNLSSPGGKFTINATPLTIAFDALSIDTIWRVGLPPIPIVEISGLTVALAGSAPIALPKISWMSMGAGLDFNLVVEGLGLSLPDFGIGRSNVDSLLWLLGFGARRSGSLGFACSLLFGWQPNLDALAGNGWSWPKFAATANPGLDWSAWPTMSPGTWGGPWSWAKLAGNPRLGLTAWWQLLFSDRLRVRAALWLFGSACMGALPDPRFALDGIGALPVQLTGSGTYTDPWAVSVLKPGIRELELIVWVEGLVDGVGWGFRLRPLAAVKDELSIETKIRIDVGFVSVSGKAAAEPIPAFHIATTLETVDGTPLAATAVGAIASVTFGARVASSQSLVVTPEITVQGAITLSVSAGQPLPANMRDALAAVFTRWGAGASAGFGNLAELLVQLGLAIKTEEAYGLHPNGLDTFAANPTNFVARLLTSAWTTPATRDALIEAAAAVLGPWLATVMGSTTAPTWQAVGQLLVSLGWATEGTFPWYPRIDTALALLEDPATALTQASASLATGEARATLRTAITSVAGAAPVPLGGGLTLAIDAKGAISLSLNGPLGARPFTPLTPSATLTVDTISAAVMLTVGASGGTAGVAVTYTAGNKTVAVTIAGQSATLDAPGFPDLFTCAGRLIVAAIAGAGIESAVVETPEVAPLLKALGFVRSMGAGDPTYADRLVELVSPQPNLSAWQARLGLDAPGTIAKAKAAIFAAISPWAPAVFTGNGHIACAASGLSFDATLGAGDALSPTVTLGISQPLAGAAPLGAGPAVRVTAKKRAAAPNAATLAVTRAAGATTLDLTVGSSVVHLLPFGGLTSLLGAAAGGAAPQLLPWAMNLLSTNLLVTNAPRTPDLVAIGAALGIKSVLDAQAWATTPAKKLLAAFSSPALPATISALATIAGVTAQASSINIAGRTTGWTLQAAVGTGGALLPPSLQLAATHSLVNLAAEISIADPKAYSVTAIVSPPLNVGYGISPAMRMTTNSAAPLTASFYPFGTPIPVTGCTVLRVDFAPTLGVVGEDAAGAPSAALLPNALETFARQVVLPEAIGWLLSTPGSAVANFLAQTDAGGALAGALKAAGVIAGGPLVWTVAQPPGPPLGTPVGNLINGINALLGAASAWWPPLPHGISLYSNPPDLGVRVTIEDLTLSTSPSVVLKTQTDPTGKWAGPDDDGLPGIVVVLLSGTKFSPKLIGTVGLSLDGSAEQPLLGPIGTVSLDGLDAWVRPSITFDAAKPFEIAYWGRLRGVTLPMSLISGGGGIVAALTGGSASSTTQTNAPKITAGVQIPTTGGPVLDFSGTVSIPIQAGFGPLHIGTILLSASSSSLDIGLDAGVNVGGLDCELDELGVSIPVITAFTPNTWAPTLSGLGLSYDSDDVSISGQLLRSAGPPVSFDGQCSIEVAGYGLGAVGGFAPGPPASFYIFAALDAPIGGPPCFFITGVAAGFGYNRGIVVPDVSEVDTFPLLQAFGRIPTSASAPPPSAGMAQTFTTAPAFFPAMPGSGWFALGLKFTTFVVIQGRAVAYVELGDGVEVGIVGEANLVLPTDDSAIVSIDLLLRARFSTKDGVFSIEARLSDSSWLFTQDCRLTGGFAFYIWFGESHRGEFVITLGGYHPQFKAPTYYPTCPRLGFEWTPTSSVVIKGESYFALTPYCVMTGGRLDARYSAGGVQAWFTAYADILVSWKPFYYEFDVGISIGVKCWAFSVELSASVTIWGPQFSAEAHVSVFFVSFTVAFGAADSKTPPAPLKLPDFLATLPSTSTQERTLVSASVASGLLPRSGPNDTATRVSPAFTLKVETSFALYGVEAFGAAVPTGITAVEIDFAPTGRSSANPTMAVTMTSSKGPVIMTPELAIVLGNAPVALWYIDAAGPTGALNPSQHAAYDSIPRGVVLTFVPEPVGYFGCFDPDGDPAEYVPVQRWNPLLAALPGPAPARRALAMQRASVASNEPRALSLATPAVRRIPLANDLDLLRGGGDRHARRIRRPSSERVRLAISVAATEMAHITVPDRYSGKLSLDRRARVIELDRAGAVRSDRLVVGTTSLSTQTRVVVIGAPSLLASEKGAAVAGWTERSQLSVISSKVLVGAGCVVTLRSAPTRFRRRRLGYSAQPAAVVGAALAEQRSLVTTLSTSGRLRAVGVLLELRPKVATPDPLDDVLVSPSWSQGSASADHAVLDGSRVLLLYACPHDGGPSSVSIESTESWFVHGVVGFRQSVAETAENVANSGLDTVLLERVAQRAALTYELKKE